MNFPFELTIKNCSGCELAKERNQVVIGTGSAKAAVMFIGEAPGKNEDLTGVPFVGAAGKRFDALLDIAGIKREDVYIANVVKCRPPKNRDPKPAEIAACRPYLEQQLEVIKPRFIVTLGNFATKFMLGKDLSITDAHGKLAKSERSKAMVFPVFHPASAIYDPSKQPLLEADFAYLGKLVRGELHA